MQYAHNLVERPTLKVICVPQEDNWDICENICETFCVNNRRMSQSASAWVLSESPQLQLGVSGSPPPVTQKKLLLCLLVWMGSTGTYRCGVLENNRPKRRKRTCWNIHENLPELLRSGDYWTHWTHWHQELGNLKHVREASACSMHPNDHTHRGWNKRPSRSFLNTSSKITGALLLGVTKCGWLPAVALEYLEWKWVRSVWANHWKYCMISSLPLKTTAWFCYQ